MALAQSINTEKAIAELEANPNALLVDVRDESEVAVTGLGTQAFNAPGRSIAWLADTDTDNDYRTPELQDRVRRIVTTCGMSPCNRGAKAANLLMKIGFSDVVPVEGGMTALLAAGLITESPTRPSQVIEIGEAQLPGS